MKKLKKMESYNDAKKGYFLMATGFYFILCLMVYMDNCVGGYEFHEFLEKIHEPIMSFTIIFIPILTIMFFRYYPYSHSRIKALTSGTTYSGKIKAIKRIKGKGFNDVFYYLIVEYNANGNTRTFNSEYYISRPHQYVYEGMRCQVYEYKGKTYIQDFFSNAQQYNDINEHYMQKSNERKYDKTKAAYDEKDDVCTYITEAESLKKRTKIITIIYVLVVAYNIFASIGNEDAFFTNYIWIILFTIFYIPSQVPVLIYCINRDNKLNKAKSVGQVYKGTVISGHKIERYKKYTLPGKHKDTFYVCKVEFYKNNKVFYYETEPFVDMTEETIPLNFSCNVYQYNGKHYVDTVFFKDERSEQKFDIPTIEVFEKNILMEKEFKMQRMQAIYTNTPGYILPLPMKIDFKDNVTREIVIDIKTDSSQGSELSAPFTKDLCNYVSEICNEKTSEDLEEIKELISSKLELLLELYYQYVEIEWIKIVFI